MTIVYVDRQPGSRIYDFAEVIDGVPVHPGDLEARVRELVATSRPFCTNSDVVLAILGHLIRAGDLKLPVHVIVTDAEGVERTVRHDVNGEFIEPWPEDDNQQESTLSARFHYRYAIPWRKT